MNTIEISSILSHNPYTKPYFRGVYSSNNIPLFDKHFPHGLVVNTDRAGEPGTHWVAIFAINRDSAEYFDSYGKPPNKDIEKYLEENFKKVTKNETKIQSIFDISCGPHVIYYLVQRCRGRSLISIVNELLSSPYSDSLVKLFVYELLNTAAAAAAT